MNGKRQVAIVHYNTPELTNATIMSLRKHGGELYDVFVFDNSDERPFTAADAAGTVTVFDNTKGKIIDFEKELAKYPEKDKAIGCAGGCVFGSDKHMMSVQKLWELLPDGFLLMDSDILIRQSVDGMFQYDQCAVGHISVGMSYGKERLVPYLLWINVPLCKERGAVFFDPDRSWALHAGAKNPKNGWDTGAALLNDIRSHKNGLCGKKVDIRQLMYHLGGGSWRNKEKAHAWLQEHRDLWDIQGKPKYTVLSYIFGGYEIVQEVKEKDPQAEYVLVTDDPNLRSETWNIRLEQSLPGTVMDKCYYVRFHPFQYANTNTVVRIDGCIEIQKSLGELINAFNDGKYDRCMMIHPVRNTFDEELDCWIGGRKYPKEVAVRCLDMMTRWGYDVNGYKGMFQGCFEIVRNTPVNLDINRLTYCLMKYTGGDEGIDRLDQHITSFVINSQFADKVSILPVSEHLVTDGRLMKWYYHHTKREHPSPKLEAAMMFNKPVKCWDDPDADATGTVAEKQSKPKTAKRGNRKEKK